MLRGVKELIGYKLSATDGEVGKTKDLYFDDHTWVVRYLVADTGGWLRDRKVLIPRVVLGEPDWATQTFAVGMSKQQVEDSPPISEHEPVSRQHEALLHEFLSVEPYWAGFPEGAYVVAARAAASEVKKPQTATGNQDPNLRSCVAVKGYHIEAADGEIGHVEDFIVDDDGWVIRYLVVDPHNILPGRKVLVAVPWIDEIDWADSKVRVDLTREQVKGAPEFDPVAPVNRRIEERLYDYYGRPSYWE